MACPRPVSLVVRHTLNNNSSVKIGIVLHPVSRWLLVVMMSSLSLTAWGVSGQKIPQVALRCERLPAMHIARTAHHSFFVNGEMVVMGGHTSGFVPTPTAEFLKDGEWHVVDMVYPHDHGMGHVLPSGDVLIAGGHEKSLGIGQTFTLELYNPVTHTFNGYGCLDKKRCIASATAIDSGQVIFSGSWYCDDGIEVYDGTRQNKFVKATSQQRCVPYILRTAKDNAVIFGSYDLHGEALDTIIVDRLKGEPFTVPLFETWRPYCSQVCFHSVDCFVGDESEGSYRYLITAVNKEGQLAFIQVNGEQFSLLPTAAPVPMKSQWGRIQYMSYVIADRKAGRAYVIGYGVDEGDRRVYVLAVNYTILPAELTLYYTEPMEDVGFTTPVLTDDGNLLMAGGVKMPGNNFEPQSTAILLCVNGSDEGSSTALLWWLGGVVFLMAAAVAFLIIYRRRRRMMVEDVQSKDVSEQLMLRIDQAMVQGQMFRRSDLKVSDVATALLTNARYVSECIKQQRGQTFVQYANSHRVAYSQQLMSQNPEKKMTEIYIEAGFTNESTFFRTFKAMTGETPKEWIQKRNKK